MGDVLLAGLAVGMLYLVVRNSQADGVNSGESFDVSSWLTGSDSNGENLAGVGSGGTGGAVATLQQWAEAIFHFEGGHAGDLNVRNNNPGNLKYAGQSGAIGADSRGFAVFSSMSDGYNALVADLQAKANKYSDWTLLQVMTRYLGGNPSNPQKTAEGDPIAYSNFVAKKLGVSAGDKLGDIFG